MSDKQRSSSNYDYNKHYNNDNNDNNDEDDTELCEVFRVFDSNDDARITADELSNILHCLGEHLSEVADRSTIHFYRAACNADAVL